LKKIGLVDVLNGEMPIKKLCF